MHGFTLIPPILWEMKAWAHTCLPPTKTHPASYSRVQISLTILGSLDPWRFGSAGLDHLLHSGRGAGGTSQEGEAAELHVACFMGLVSFLASRLEVLRVGSRHTQGLLNAAARANIQSATITDTPLTDAGLDGAGEVIQVFCRACWWFIVLVYVHHMYENKASRGHCFLVIAPNARWGADAFLFWLHMLPQRELNPPLAGSALRPCSSSSSSSSSM